MRLSKLVPAITIALFSIVALLFSASPTAKASITTVDFADIYTVSAIAKHDSLFGSSGSVKIVSAFQPSPKRCNEYILALDSISGKYATACTTQIILKAVDASGRVVGSAIVDTIKALSAPKQVVIPMAETIVGYAYDLYLSNTKATDSIYTNRMYLVPRKACQ